VRRATHAGMKVGLRVPGVYYIARTIALDRAFIVRRGIPRCPSRCATRAL